MVFQILLLIIVVVFLCTVIYVLFAPLLIEIDSNNKVYQIRIVPVLRLWWVTDDFLGHPEMSFLGIHKTFFFPDLKNKTTNFRNETTKEKTKNGLSLKLNFRRVLAIIKSFKVIKCLVNIDTGNMPLNGKLFPVMYLLSRITGKTFYINFVGKNEVVLTIKNNAFNILKAYIKNK